MSSYINHGEGPVPGHHPHRITLSWERFTHNRMKWLYGPFYTVERRTKTQADLDAWNRLGTRDAA